MTAQTNLASDLGFGEPTLLAAVGGSRIFGQTVINWVPSSTEMSVKVTVTMGGVVIKESTLTPNSLQMVYNAASGPDTSMGKINASFGPDGKSGKINGDLKWNYEGDPGNYMGFIGSWSV